MPDISNGTVVSKGKEHLYITNVFRDARKLLEEGKNVLYLPEEISGSIEGFYCTDFWCYPMFRDICEWMKKPVAVGTMGLLIQNKHNALFSFPSYMYATPQWYKIVSHSRCVILDNVTDKGYKPIIEYGVSGLFNPEEELGLDKLEKVFTGNN